MKLEDIIGKEAALQLLAQSKTRKNPAVSHRILVETVKVQRTKNSFPWAVEVVLRAFKRRMLTADEVT